VSLLGTQPKVREFSLMPTGIQSISKRSRGSPLFRRSSVGMQSATLHVVRGESRRGRGSGPDGIPTPSVGTRGRQSGSARSLKTSTAHFSTRTKEKSFHPAPYSGPPSRCSSLRNNENKKKPGPPRGSRAQPGRTTLASDSCRIRQATRRFRHSHGVRSVVTSGSHRILRATRAILRSVAVGSHLTLDEIAC
jgi:hypothetical protein